MCSVLMMDDQMSNLPTMKNLIQVLHNFYSMWEKINILFNKQQHCGFSLKATLLDYVMNINFPHLIVVVTINLHLHHSYE